MGAFIQPRIAVVTRETRLDNLKRRWGTSGQAKFVFRTAKRKARASADSLTAVKAAEAAADADFDAIEDEDQDYREATSRLSRDLDFGIPVHVFDRQYVSSYDFGMCAAVVVVGQDGLVANTAKYALDVPIVGVNPDPRRFDGVLLPFQLSEARDAVQAVLARRANVREVTLAKATLHDGQKLLAFNDLFVGAKSHVSARYRLETGGRAEEQSSSGMLVATGAGSTGWMSSVFNVARGVSEFLGHPFPTQRYAFRWEDRRLLWAVREPFVSRTSAAELVMGTVEEGDSLVVESIMSAGGVIFSDGIESDFLEFNAGAIARLGVAEERALLVAK
jgi:NAD kinase